MLTESNGLLALLEPKLTGTTKQPRVERQWYNLREVEALFEKCGLTAALWFSAGVLLQLASRGSILEPGLAKRTTDVAELLLAKTWDRRFAFNKEAAGAEIEATPAINAELSDTEWVLKNATAIGIRLIYMASKDTITREWKWHTPWDLAATLHVGALHVLYGQQDVYIFETWYKHARKVVQANERRKDALPESKEWGRPIPPTLLSAEHKVSINGFGGFDSKAFLASVRGGKNWLLP